VLAMMINHGRLGNARKKQKERQEPKQIRKAKNRLPSRTERTTRMRV
jgi:hypothetical protein